jgi:dUTP pyrophosphatase
MKIPFNIKRLTKSAIIPTRAYEGDLGYDLYADEHIVLKPLERVKISTGIAVQFPQGWGGFIKDRSSMAIKKLITTGGVIDNGYTGELSVIMTYLANPEYGYFEIKKGDKIAQLVPIPITNWEITEVQDFTSSERGDKGFGSSEKMLKKILETTLP